MSLRDVEVELKPLTIFIGKNAAGKSAIFKALVTLSKLLNGMPLRGKEMEFNLDRGVTLDQLVWQGNSGLPMRFQLWLEDNTGADPDYSLELARRAGGWCVVRERLRSETGWIEVNETQAFDHPTERRGTQSVRPPMRGTLRFLVHPYIGDTQARPHLEPIIKTIDRIGQVWRYRPSASDIAAPVDVDPEDRGKFYVRENGWGVALALQTLQGAERPAFEKIEAGLRTIFPHIQTIGLRSDYQGVRMTFKTNRSQDPIPATQEADGVLLATFLLWRLYETKLAKRSLTICLEEPENGLYPELLGDRLELLNNFVDPVNGNALQILVATHSIEFMRRLKSHRSLSGVVREVEFDPSRGSSVRELTYQQVGNLVEQYSNPIAVAGIN